MSLFFFFFVCTVILKVNAGLDVFLDKSGSHGTRISISFILI